MTAKGLRPVLARLQAIHPTLHPVIIRFVDMDDDSAGDTSIVTIRGTPRIRIRLNKRLTPSVAVLLAFAHEYAHAMQWRPDHQEETRMDDHDAEFGVHAATIWRLVGA